MAIIFCLRSLCHEKRASVDGNKTIRLVMTFTFVTTKCQKEKNAPNKKGPEYTMTSNFHHSKSEIYFIIKR